MHRGALHLFVNVSTVTNVQHPNNEKLPNYGIEHPKRPHAESIQIFMPTQGLYISNIGQPLNRSQKPLPLDLWLSL